jgi:hypothetical protein
MSIQLLFLAASFIRGIVPSTPLEGLPGHFASGFLSAQPFFLLYCIVGIFSAPPKNE